jgi:phosphatidate cytidylyltransferase
VSSNLTQRILFAIPAAILVITATWYGGYVFQGLMLLIVAILINEIIPISDRCGLPVNEAFAYMGGIAILFIPDWTYAQIVGVFWLLGLVIAELGRQQKELRLVKLVATPFWALYMGIGIRSLLDIRAIELSNSMNGIILTIALFLMVWGNDVFAYFAGRSLGKRKFSPAISPNKTWEGFYGGILGAYVGFGLVYFFEPAWFPFELEWLLPLPLLISIVGPIGDLTESKFKRVAGVKDSSNLLPGHGGMFDRMDALLLSAPLMFVYLDLVMRLTNAN